jgi:hypothetical protein
MFLHHEAENSPPVEPWTAVFYEMGGTRHFGKLTARPFEDVMKDLNAK